MASARDPQSCKGACDIHYVTQPLHSKINISEAIKINLHLILIRHFTRAFQNTPQNRWIKLRDVVCTATTTCNEDQVLAQMNLLPEAKLPVGRAMTVL